MNIISVSRRTDIPFYYHKWFKEKLKKGFVFVKNPFNPSQEKVVSLKKKDVVGFVFWSRNYENFFDVFEKLKEENIFFYLHFTLNNYPLKIEPYLKYYKINFFIEQLNYISKIIGAERIWWRYDPVFITDKMDYRFHKDNFYFLCKSLKGAVGRCITSIYSPYKKSERRFKKLNIKVSLPPLKLFENFREIADFFNVKLYACSSPLLQEAGLPPAGCISFDFIKMHLSKPIFFKSKKVPTRQNCTCDYAIDIGFYSSCKSKCVYCYAV